MPLRCCGLLAYYWLGLPLKIRAISCRKYLRLDI